MNFENVYEFVFEVIELEFVSEAGVFSRVSLENSRESLGIQQHPRAS